MTETSAGNPLTLTFERRGRFGQARETVTFDLGDDRDNRLCALEHAWNTNSRIIPESEAAA